RRAALTALSRLKPTTILEDATVPRSEIPKMVKAINEIADKYQVTICTFGHAGDGNLHPTGLTDARDEEEIALVMQAFEENFKERAYKDQVTICKFGQEGDRNLHPNLLTDARDEAEIALVMQAFEEIFKEAAFLGGTITGEHGVGMMKLPYLHLKTGEAGLEAMRAIKKALDPNNIMNPGKMLLLEEEAEV